MLEHLEFQIRGNILIKEAINNNIKVTTLPGATAVIPAIVTSGFDTSHFVFYGFLNNNQSKRKKELENILKFPYPTIIYEAPHRIKKTLNTLANLNKNIKVCIGREISKIHEEYIYGNPKDILEKELDLKGEIVLIVYNEQNNVETKNFFDNLTLEEHYEYYFKKGFTKKEIIKQISKDLNVHKNEIYKKFMD